MLLALALGVALFVQHLGLVPAGISTALIIAHVFTATRRVKHWPSYAWLGLLFAAAFFIRPVDGGSVHFWTLAALPIIALTLGEPAKVAAWCGGLIVLFAIGLIAQEVMSVRYSSYNFDGRAWPMLDPNNAAAIINIALIPAIALMRRSWLITASVPILVAGLVITASKAGVLCALGGVWLLCLRKWRVAALGVLVACMVAVPVMLTIFPELVTYITWPAEDRLPIWSSALMAAAVEPWIGFGLGTFADVYRLVRTEGYTAGWHAHNDLLQMAVEMGWPMAGAFAWYMLRTISTLSLPAIVLAVIFMQGMVSFQFYIPAISILAGVAMACHINSINNKRRWR